jgi:hypothetical protein
MTRRDDRVTANPPQASLLAFDLFRIWTAPICATLQRGGRRSDGLARVASCGSSPGERTPADRRDFRSSARRSSGITQAATDDERGVWLVY